MTRLDKYMEYFALGENGQSLIVTVEQGNNLKRGQKNATFPIILQVILETEHSTQ